jgi:superfamily II RNA helicase
MIYDDFQNKAIEAINKGETVIVSAPTGAGKTVIAEYAIDHARQSGNQAIYTSPIKALSNQKYRDFREKYGEEAVGILTGDVSLNSGAPILIMTTEIYRNTLFENPERFRDVSWVIYDEIHYLDDLERGTVWEESIMFSPPHIKFIGLSATVPNIEELAEWIESIHDCTVTVIVEKNRPVPLKHRFQCQGRVQYTAPDLRRYGFLGCDDWSGRSRRRGPSPKDFKIKQNRLTKLISHIQDADELPCIYFVFSRQKAKMLAEEIAEFNFLSHDEHDSVCELFWSLCEKYNLGKEKSVLELFDLVRRGIAFHHAGMLPTLKEVVEQLFTHKALKLIFTTETFALGINMPARCVVFDELRKFHGTHFGNLRTRDYYQMAGRAGRRGMDKCGFVYSRINPKYISFPEITRIINGRPEAVISQFNATYATVLNLYKEYGRDLINIYPRSFHFFQASKKKRRQGLSLLEDKLKLLESMAYIEKGKVTNKGEFACSLYGYELPIAEMHNEKFLEYLSEEELAMVLVSLVFEPRKNDTEPAFETRIKKLIQSTDAYLKDIHKQERKFDIWPFTKVCHFHLAPAIGEWMRGIDFEELIEITSVDEGEIVRYFRMVIQLLRQIKTAHGAPQKLQEIAANTLKKINRDLIDAEKQLRV